MGGARNPQLQWPHSIPHVESARFAGRRGVQFLCSAPRRRFGACEITCPGNRADWHGRVPACRGPAYHSNSRVHSACQSHLHVCRRPQAGWRMQAAQRGVQGSGTAHQHRPLQRNRQAGLAETAFPGLALQRQGLRDAAARDKKAVQDDDPLRWTAGRHKERLIGSRNHTIAGLSGSS